MNGQIDRSGARLQRQCDFALVQIRLVPAVVLTTDDGMAQLDVPRPYRTRWMISTSSAAIVARAANAMRRPSLSTAGLSLSGTP